MKASLRLPALPRALAERPLWYLGCGVFTGAAAAAGDGAGAAVGLILTLAPLGRCRAGVQGGVTKGTAALLAGAVLAGWFAAAGALTGLKQAPEALAGTLQPGATITGRVRAVEPGPRGLRLLLSIPGIAGQVAVEWPAGPEDPRRWPLPGDRATVAVAHPPEPPRAARNPFAFDPRRYWYGRHVGVVVEARWATMAPGPWSPQRGLAAWRHQRLGRLRQVLSPPAAGLLEALLFGVRAGMDAGVQEAFRQSGISHLLAVSGLHVGLVAAGAGRLAVWSGLAGPARWAVTAVAAALYAALAGAGPPVNRAAVGAVLITAGPLLSRPVDGLNLLGAAACWALLPRPLSALDLSFRLSFLAVAGMLLLAGPLQALLPGGARARAVVRGLAAGIAAQLALAPLLAASFGELAWAGAPATVITLPPLALLLAAGGAWTLIDGVCPACAAPLIPALEGLAWTVARVGGLLARPGAVWSVPSPPGWWAALYYLWVFGWAADWRSTAERLRRRETDGPRRFLIAALGLAALLVLGTAALTPRHLEIVFLDVGQGDAIALGAPGGIWGTVDTGRRGAELTAFLRARGVRRLAWSAVTHPHADHAGGLDALVRAYPQVTLVTAEEAGGAGAPAGLVVNRGHRLALGPVPIQVLGPPAAGRPGWSVNDRSLVLRVEWAGWRVLLTGDIEAAAEEALLAAGGSLEADVLKVAHHGSDTSTSAAWLAGVRPRLAVISVGSGNAYGHPHQAVLQRLAAAGVTVMRTDLHGAVWMRLRPGVVDITYYGPDGPRRLRLPGAQDRRGGERREEAWSTPRLSAGWNAANRRPFTWCTDPKPIWSGPSSTACGRWPWSRPSTSRSSTAPSTLSRRSWRPPASCRCSGRAASSWPWPMRGSAGAAGPWAPRTWRPWRLTRPIRRRRRRWPSWLRNRTGA